MPSECGVCLDTYTQEGEKVPKVLPCSHTLCLGCAKQLSRGGRVVCPECRKTNVILGPGAQAFPTNRYILENIKVQPLEAQEETKCEEHSKPWAVFCADPRCLKMLCPLCPMQDHADHKNLVGPFDTLKDSVDLNFIRTEATATAKNLEEYQKKVEAMKKTVTTAGEEAKKKIAEALDEVMKEAEALNKEVDEKVNKQTRNLDQMKQKAQQKRKVKDEVVQAANDLRGEKVFSSYKRYTKLVEKLDTFKQQAKDISKTTPPAQIVKFAAKPRGPGEPFLGTTINTLHAFRDDHDEAI